MRNIVYWSHFTPESRSAAGQRMYAFIAQLVADGWCVRLPGGGFQSVQPTWRRLLVEAWLTLHRPALIAVVSLPPYRSALMQALLLAMLRGRRLVIDQRDLALVSAPTIEHRMERWLLRRADALIVTTHAQRRAMMRRHCVLPRTWLIRNGASDDIAQLPRVPRKIPSEKERLRVLYQGLVGGKKLKEITQCLAGLGCDVDLAVFVDKWSREEIKDIYDSWNGTGTLNIHANLDASALAHLMDQVDVAINPVPDHMDYAFTVKTADYAVRLLPQLAIGSRRSITRRTVELCHLGTAINTNKELDEKVLRLAIARFRPRTEEELDIFRREVHAPRIIDLLQEVQQ